MFKGLDSCTNHVPQALLGIRAIIAPVRPASTMDPQKLRLGPKAERPLKPRLKAAIAAALEVHGDSS